MKDLVPIHELFDPIYGVNLELLNLQICNSHESDAIRFISRKESDNGLAAYVKRIENVNPNPAHTISVAVSGSVMSSFYQDKEYYSGRDIYCLRPKNEMSIEEMLFYAFCLRANKYRYNYGRGANRTLKNILVPNSPPSKFRNLSQIEVPKPTAAILIPPPELATEKWGKFQLSDLFEVKKGKRLTKEDMEDGITPFVGAVTSNNGWSHRIGQPAIFDGNVITVNYDGNGVGEAYYQPMPFWALDSVNVLYPKFPLNKYVALFICTTIKKEKYRFSYGRKWHKERMENSIVSLPAKDGKPDFQFMERYIKSLPYSSALLIDKNELMEQPITAKQRTKIEKGLSDKELIEKYEAGSLPMKKIMKGMLNTEPPSK